MNNAILYLLLVSLIFFSCQSDESIRPADTPPNNSSNGLITITPTGDEQYLNKKSDYIFDQGKLPTFELTIPFENLSVIDEDPVAEEYVEGSLTFEGETLSPIGIRYKGSIGAFIGCVSGRNWSNPSGHKTCTKLSMKVKINWEDTDAKFYGLKKLQFHAMNSEETQMHDRLGYWLFRQMGVPAPRAIHARLVINGQYSGLYALVEQIDGRFTRYNYEDGKGNLYKEIWPLKDSGQPHTEKTYIEHLKTNEDENPSTEMIQSFAREIADAKETELPSVINKWMDIDEIISYIVVDRTIRNDDGAFHWYCNNGDCNPHNFYWYEEPTQKSMHLIPWDLDHAFENIITNANPVTPIADSWGTTRNDCQPFSQGFLGIKQRSAACDKLTRGWAGFTEEFQTKKEAFLKGPFSEAVVMNKLDIWTEQIRTATIEADQLHNDALTIEKWESALENLKAQLRFAGSK